MSRLFRAMLGFALACGWSAMMYRLAFPAGVEVTEWVLGIVTGVGSALGFAAAVAFVVED